MTYGTAKNYEQKNHWLWGTKKGDSVTPTVLNTTFEFLASANLKGFFFDGHERSLKNQIGKGLDRMIFQEAGDSLGRSSRRKSGTLVKQSRLENSSED
jgi:cytochrome c peroxidase